MKIVLITPHYGPPWNEGVRNMARCLVAFLQSKGEEVSIISPNLPREPGLFHTLLWRISLFRSLEFNFSAARRVKQLNPDAVLVLTSLSSVLGVKSWLLKKVTRKPQILYITGLRRLILGYRVFLNPQKIIVNSDFLKAFFTEAEVIPPFIDSTKWVKNLIVLLKSTYHVM